MFLYCLFRPSSSFLSNKDTPPSTVLMTDAAGEHKDVKSGNENTRTMSEIVNSKKTRSND